MEAGVWGPFVVSATAARLLGLVRGAGRVPDEEDSLSGGTPEEKLRGSGLSKREQLE
jgi:hypothetical protein